MDYHADVVIVGGGTGGCAAALACARNGLRVLLLEETDWVGGQFTSQGVPPDEHGWIEDFGCTRSYRQLRDTIRAHYGGLRNPGNGWVSPLCHEPTVSWSILDSWLAGQKVQVLLGARCTAADVGVDTVDAIRFDHQGDTHTATARWFLDATELGDLLPLSGTDFVTGSEARRDTGEPSAPLEARPENVQAFSWCFAMEHHEGQDHTITRPPRYDYWRDYVPRIEPPWPGRLLSWVTPNPRTMQPNHYRFHPHGEAPKVFSGLWSYRRLVDRSLFPPGRFSSDICLVNWPLIDYLDGDLCTATAEQRTRYLAESKEMSMAVFYWMQTEAPRADGSCGWPGLKLAPNALGTADGFAKAPYIRESRRIRALQTIVEQDVAAACRPGEVHGKPYPDSIGIGYYRIDLHPSTGGDNYIDVAALPFQIPLGAIIPVRMRNLLPACKNIGTTHITNGCYRLHPVEWNIGEAAGLLLAWCSQMATDPHSVHLAPASFQDFLRKEGLELLWPADLRLDDGDPHIHAH